MDRAGGRLYSTKPWQGHTWGYGCTSWAKPDVGQIVYFTAKVVSQTIDKAQSINGDAEIEVQAS